jgi:RNA polymerase sigma factor (sigma-70 family)
MAYKLDKYTPLTFDETISNLKEFQETGNTEARNRVVEANLRLAMKITHKYCNAYMTFDELSAVGVEGLIHACNKYDTTSKAKPSIYFYRYIAGYILNFINSTHSRNLKNSPLDAPIYNDGEGKTIADTFSSKAKSPFAECAFNDDAERINKALETLSDRERAVIESLFSLNNNDKRTLEDIGASLNMTKQGARAMKLRALDKLRTVLA